MCVRFGNEQETSPLDLEQTQDTSFVCVCALAMYKKTSPFRFRVNSDIAPCPIFGYEIRYYNKVNLLLDT